MSVGEIAWERYEGPQGYQPSSVPVAIESMARAQTQDDAWDAYNAILSAIGNNHAGTSYPVVVGVLPLIVEMTAADGQWTRFAAAQVLIECATSFRPEPGFEMTQVPDRGTTDVGATVKHQLETARIRLAYQVQREPHPEVRAALSELVEHLPGPTGDH